MVNRKQPQADVNVDEMLHSLKSFGFFQISQFLLISSMVIAVDSIVYVIVFVGPHVDFKCKNLTDAQLENFTTYTNIGHVTYEKCNIKVYSEAENATLIDSLTCINGYEYSPSKERSIISQWDLVCSKNGLAELSQTCFIIGQSASAFIFPILAEKFGRRPVHITCGCFVMLTALICTFSSEYWIFVLGRILTGLFEEGYVISGITAICELFSTDKRSFMTGVYSILWSSAMSVPALVAYLIRNYTWRIYSFYAGMMSIFFVVEIFFLEESIRWLFVMGKVMKAKKVIERACQQNKTDFPTVWAVAEKELAKTVDIHADENAIYTITVYLPDEKTTSTVNNLPEIKEDMSESSCKIVNDKKEAAKIFKLITIFKHPFTRYMTLVNIFNWLVINASYNSIYMLSEDLSGNMYLNFFLLAMMETTAAAVYCIGIKRFGHKIPMISCELLGSVSLITACFINKFGGSSSLNRTVFRILHLCAMFGIGACFGGVYIYTPELYPTDVRSVGLGIASSFSRCGTMLAPFSRVLIEYAEWAPSALFGVGLLISAVLISFFLPETSKTQLPQTMDELVKLKKQKKLKDKLDQVYEQNVEE